MLEYSMEVVLYRIYSKDSKNCRDVSNFKNFGKTSDGNNFGSIVAVVGTYVTVRTAGT